MKPPQAKDAPGRTTDNPLLTTAMRKLRRRRPTLSRWAPFVYRSEMFPQGLMAQLWFLTRGCQWDACTMCDYGRGPSVGVSEMVSAVAQGLDALGGMELSLLEVSPSGSMLDPDEVPTAARQRIFGLMRGFAVEHVLFETRAETVSADTATEVANSFPEQKVGIMIGLESKDPFVQRFCVNKGGRPEWFGHAAQIMHAHNIEVIANVSLGTAFLSPKEAVADAVATVRWAVRHGADWAVLYPLQIKPHTLLAELHRLGRYHSPSFWSLVETLRQLGPELGARTTMAWYKNYYDQPFIETVTSCPRCHDDVLARLDALHASPDYAIIKDLDQATCACKEQWRRTLAAPHAPLIERLPVAYAELAQTMGLTSLWQREGDATRAAMVASYAETQP